MSRFYQLMEITLLVVTWLATATNAYAQTKFELSATEKQLLALTNQERAKIKLPPLRPNPVLFQAARSHSANMARQGEMNHVLDGKDPFQRLKEVGYRFSTAGENIAYGFASPANVIQVWMESPGHRRNILDPDFTEIGLGRVTDEQGVPFYTQVFALPARGK